MLAWMAVSVQGSACATSMALYKVVSGITLLTACARSAFCRCGGGFFDGAQFEIMAFREGETLPDEEWQAPDYCFKQGQKWLPQRSQLKLI